MSMLGKILGIASIGEALSGLHLARKFIIDVAVIIMLTIIGAMIAGGLAVATLYECDAVMVRHGLNPDVAALLTGLLGLCALGGITAIISYKIERMQNFPFKFSGGIANTSIETAQSLARGFYNGLIKKR